MVQVCNHVGQNLFVCLSSFLVDRAIIGLEKGAFVFDYMLFPLHAVCLIVELTQVDGQREVGAQSSPPRG